MHDAEIPSPKRKTRCVEAQERHEPGRQFKAVLFDFGGVLSSSPFEAFTRYERENALPEGFLRRLNATNPDANAWAQLERNEVDVETFCAMYEAEAVAAGNMVEGRAVIACLAGDLRPQMLDAVRRCRSGGLRTGCITNNIAALHGDDGWRDDLDLDELFDVLIESSKVGVRKPDPAIYTMACDALGVDPTEAVFLDDLGVNLKPARALGMTTIKVEDPDHALTELETVLGFSLRDEHR